MICETRSCTAKVCIRLLLLARVKPAAVVGAVFLDAEVFGGEVGCAVAYWCQMMHALCTDICEGW